MSGTAPTIGAIGTTTTDPDFGSSVLRVTDVTSCGAPAGNHGWSPNAGDGWHRSWSKDSNKIILTGTDSGADWNYQSITPNPFTTSGSCISMSGKLNYAPGFSASTSDTLYGIWTDNFSLGTWDTVTAHASTKIFDMSTIPGFSKPGTRYTTLEFDDSDTWFCTANDGQDVVTATRVGCYNKTTTNTQVLNIAAATEQQNSSSAVALDNLTSTQLANCRIHEIIMAPDASWLKVTMNNCTAFPAAAYTIFWQMGSNHVNYLQAAFSSHEAMGWSGAYINTPHNQPPCPTYDNRGWAYFFSSSLGTAVSPNLVEMYGCVVIADGNDFDSHSTWLNNRNDANANAYPIIVMPFPGASGDTNHNYYMEWEIDAIQTSPALANLNTASYLTAPTAIVWREAHTFNDPYGQQCSDLGFLSPSVSPNGEFVAFPSDWQGQTGTGPCTNSRRYDTFIVDMATTGGGSATGAQSKMLPGTRILKGTMLP